MATQACTKGPVVESKKYGSPTVANNSNKMRTEGSVSGSGFQWSPATMGNQAKEINTKTVCKMACLRWSRRRTTQSVYP